MFVLEVLAVAALAILLLVLLLGPSVVCFLKGKWVSGVVGLIVVLPVCWIWACGAAVRLARPGSVWWRRRYSGEKLARARARFLSDAEGADAEERGVDGPGESQVI